MPPRAPVVTALLLVLLACAGGTPPASAHSALDTQPRLTSTSCGVTWSTHFYSKWLHTCGGKVLTPVGAKVRLNALSFQDLAPGNGPGVANRTVCPGWEQPPGNFAANVRNWGFNTVRLNISWSNLEPSPPVNGRHQWNSSYLESLDAIVNAFHAQHVGVILDMMQSRWSPAFRHVPLPNGRTTPCGIGFPQWLYPRRYRDLRGSDVVNAFIRAERRFFIHNSCGTHTKCRQLFAHAWRKVAGRYVNNPGVVGAEIMNEPYDLLAARYPGTSDLTPAKLKLRSFYTNVGKAIHNANPHLLLIAQDRRTRYGSSWSVTSRPSLPNLVLAWHLYGTKWSPAMLRASERALAHAKAWHVPLWVGEWTLFNRTIALPPPWNWRAQARTALTFFRKNGVGWALWLYGPGQFSRAGLVNRPKRNVLYVLRHYGY